MSFSFSMILLYLYLNLYSTVPPATDIFDNLEVESDRETPMWKLAFREQLEDDSAYWHLLKRTLAQAEETLSHRTAVSKAKKGVLGNCVGRSEASLEKKMNITR